MPSRAAICLARKRSRSLQREATDASSVPRIKTERLDLRYSLIIVTFRFFMIVHANSDFLGVDSIVRRPDHHPLFKLVIGDPLNLTAKKMAASPEPGFA